MRPEAPAELPAGIATFTGRDAELTALLADAAPGDRGATPVAAIVGPGGIGKSALAIHAAHRLADRFPDGQLYVNLHGATPDTAPRTPAEVLARFLRSLGVAAADIPSGEEAAAAMFRSLTASARLLVVLDNAADAAQVRPLLPGSATCAVLVTSRRALGSLVGVTHHELGVLPADAAVRLLAQIVGASRVEAESEAAAEVVRLCGGLPLALRIAGARLVARPRWRLATLAGRLAEQRHRLAELAVDDQAVRTGFGVSYDDLAGGPAARMFRLLGLLDAPDIALPAAAALADVSEVRAEDLLETLVDMHLVETPVPRRYRMHDLLRLFARERAAEEDTAAERAGAVRRALDHYLATVRSAARVVNPSDRWREDVVRWRLSVPGLAIESAAEAHAWVEREQDCLLAAGRQAAAAPDDGPEIAIGLAVAFHMPLEYRGRWREQLALGTVALRAAESTGDPRHFAIAHNDLGWAHWAMGHAAEARDHLERALGRWRSVGHLIGEGLALHGLGAIHRTEHAYAESVVLLHRARELYRQAGIEHKEAACLTGIGLSAQRLGRYDEAVAAHTEAMEAARRHGRPHTEVMALGNLAETLRLSGDPAAAARRFTEALDRAAAAGEPGTYWEAEHCWGLGRARHDLGDEAGAHEMWRRSARILHELGLITAALRTRIDEFPNPTPPEVIALQL